MTGALHRAEGQTPEGSAGFIHETAPMRVVFGAGRLTDVPAEVARLGTRRALVLCSPEQEVLGAQVTTLLADRAVGLFAEARMHVPADTAEAGRAEIRRVGADCCVSVGGGSAIGLGKAIALTTSLPVVCVPTTYSGSEMTPIWGITTAEGKSTGRTPAVLPRCVVYDPELTADLPADMTAASGMNAMAHAVEALYAPDLSPVTALVAEEAVRCLAGALPELREDPRRMSARSLALRGSWLAGMCLGTTTMSLHHKLCHVLGGLFDLPHAATHAVLLPHVAAFNLPAAPAAGAALRRALRTADPADAIADLSRSVAVPSSLAELGLRPPDLATAVDAALRQPYANPRPVARADLVDILTTALYGDADRDAPDVD